MRLEKKNIIFLGGIKENINLIILFFIFILSKIVIFSEESNIIYSKSESLEETIVSANKIEENILDIPQNITIITEHEIKEKNIKTVTDIIGEISNMNAGPNHGVQVSFRGLNASMFTNNNPVVIYVDGIPYYDRYDLNPSLDNVKQIEVLRGPQGTLYGKDAIGAVINIKTKEPKNYWQANFGSEYASNNYIQTNLNATGPLIRDKFYLGINGSFSKDDGWINNSYDSMDKNANSSKDYKTSAFLLYKPNDKFSGKFVVSNNYFKDNFINGFSTTENIDEIERKDAKNASFDVPTYSENEVKSYSLDISYKFDKFEIESLTTYKKVDIEGEYDLDFKSDNLMFDGLKQFNYANLDTFSQEIKFSGLSGNNIKWVAGIYGDVEKREQGPYGMEFPYVHPTLGFLGNYSNNVESTTDTDTQAIFGQGMVPFGDKFEFTFGGRYQRITKKIDLNAYTNPIGIESDPVFEFEGKKSWNTFLPKTALTYKYSENLSTYISVSKGYMPGGFNFFATSGDTESISFEPQKSENYETGIKYNGPNYKINASIFRMNIEDLHIYKIVSGNIWIADNAKKAHSQGVEVDAIYFFENNIELSTSLGLIDAKYDDYDTGINNYKGKNIENTPKYTWNISLAYAPYEGIYGRIDTNIIGDISYFDGANNRMVESEGAVIANVKLGYKVSNWDFYTYAKNITDAFYVDGYLSKKSLTMATFNDPRSFGIGFRYTY
jgi:iron complex outermembrane receptor protein